MSDFEKNGTALIELDGKVITKPKLLGKYGAVRVFQVIIETKRKNEKVDIFQLEYTTELGVVLNVGDFIKVNGEIRTLNEGRSDFVIESYILANSIEILPEEPEFYTNECTISYGGFHRFISTRKSYDDSGSDVTEYVVSVQRKRGRISYFRATSWNHDALYIGNSHDSIKHMNIGCRLQSYSGKKGDKHFISLNVHHFSTIREDNNDECKED